jgi:hypothetical protein
MPDARAPAADPERLGSNHSQGAHRFGHSYEA